MARSVTIKSAFHQFMNEPKKGKIAIFSRSTEPKTNSHSPLANPEIYHRQFAWQVASSLIVSFQYAWTGIVYSFQTQRNFRIHSVLAFLAIGLGLILQITATELAIITLTCAMVMVLELLNTAIESVVDLSVKQTYHDLAKIAKDCAAGAVLLSAVAAVLVAIFILLPPLWQVMGLADGSLL
jgi:diacylglycerol kinase (ATP)